MECKFHNCETFTTVAGQSSKIWNSTGNALTSSSLQQFPPGPPSLCLLSLSLHSFFLYSFGFTSMEEAKQVKQPTTDKRKIEERSRLNLATLPVGEHWLAPAS